MALSGDYQSIYVSMNITNDGLKSLLERPYMTTIRLSDCDLARARLIMSFPNIQHLAVTHMLSLDALAFLLTKNQLLSLSVVALHGSLAIVSFMSRLMHLCVYGTIFDEDAEAILRLDNLYVLDLECAIIENKTLQYIASQTTAARLLIPTLAKDPEYMSPWLRVSRLDTIGMVDVRNPAIDDYIDEIFDAVEARLLTPLAQFVRDYAVATAYR